MTKALYKKGKNALLSTSLQWSSTCTYKVMLTASEYTVNLVTDDFVADISAAYRVASGLSLSALSASDGVADGDNVTALAVSGSKIFRFVIYHDTTNEATSDLILVDDTATGLPLTPNGGDINLTFDSGTCKIYEI